MFMLRRLFSDQPLITPLLSDGRQKLVTVCSSRRWPYLLVLLALLRIPILLLAYPPAHASDSDLFFLYAERLAGYNAPLLDHITYPLYPALILVAYKWLGSVYWLIAVQMLMASVLAPIYYFALKPYSPVLAVFVSLVILVDFQSAATFNFTGAEPLYMILMALMLMIYLRQVAPGAHQRWSLADGWVGVIMVLLWLTRSIGRYLILPYALVYWLYTRDWRRALTLVAGFVGAWALYSLLSLLLLGQVAGLTATDYALARVMNHHPDWLSADNGPNSAIWLDNNATCELRTTSGDLTQFQQAYCLYLRAGTWAGAEAIISGAASETIRANLWPYTLEVWDGTLYFLSASAEIYSRTEELPSDVQCDGAADRLRLIDDDFARQDGTRTSSPLLAYEGARLQSEVTAYRDIMDGIYNAMCPPLPHSPAMRDLVDWVMFRNRSFGRPNPLLWYGGLLALALIIPWARRYLPVVLITGGTMVMLAISPAMLSVASNVRYVIPINALRIVMLSLMLFILAKLALRLLDSLVMALKARQQTRA